MRERGASASDAAMRWRSQPQASERDVGRLFAMRTAARLLPSGRLLAPRTKAKRTLELPSPDGRRGLSQIGRASCRERV